MNKTSDILTKQYIKLCNERDLLTKECDDLPVGSIQQKKIKNGVYFSLISLLQHINTTS